jgi:hypothetical protein
MPDKSELATVETGPFAATRFNALAHGVLSRHTLLPWEDRQEYDDLFQSLVAEHAPAGATQVHLVEEIAGIIWRKRRLRMAEAAVHRRGLDRAGESFSYTVKHALSHLRPAKVTDDLRHALVATPGETQSELRSLRSALKTCRGIAAGLEQEAPKSFDQSLGDLDESIRDWFDGLLDGRFQHADDYTYKRTGSDLLRFLTKEAMPWLESRVSELENRPLIREQAFGASLNPEEMEKLARYEVHLDRKLEKSLGMLYRLKELSTTGPVSQNEPDGA